MAQKWVKIGFGAIFPIFRLIFSYFLGEAETYIFPIFSLFRAGGPKWGLYQANRIARLFLSQAHPPSKMKLNNQFGRLLRWRWTLSEISAKWLCSLLMIWGFEGRGLQTPTLTELCQPPKLPTCLEIWQKVRVMPPHRASAAQNGILGPENTRSVTSRSITWWSLGFVGRRNER